MHQGDLLLMNDTKVIPAKMVAYKRSRKKGARLSVLLIEEFLDTSIPSWIMLVDPIRKISIGDALVFGEDELIGQIVSRVSEKEVLVEFKDMASPALLSDALFQLGSTPLPPYIKRSVSEDDQERYQTVYAKNTGALAAPTAGLHFTENLLDNLEQLGIDRAFLTLHIGMGTFNPIYEEDLSKVKLHKERFEIGEETAERINKTLSGNHSLVAVGTTTLRTLEAAMKLQGRLSAISGDADLFIKPGYNWQVPTSLITNFHTPGSSLLMMIAAYMGYDLMREVYDCAIKEEYRFYSYGDAMLILP